MLVAIWFGSIYRTLQQQTKQTDKRPEQISAINAEVVDKLYTLVQAAFIPELQMYIHIILQLALNSSKLTEIYLNSYIN